MEEALDLARAKDTKERMAGVERLHELLEASRKTYSATEVASLVDVLDSAAVLSGEHLKLHFNALVPAVVERLGDSKQPVRDAARRLLLTLMELCSLILGLLTSTLISSLRMVSSPTIIVERAGSYAWTHKSWRVREEFARTVTSAIGLFVSTELPLQRAILPSEMYTQAGTHFLEELHKHHLSTTLLVGRLSLEELMGQLPSFLPALFDAFGSQSADVCKTVVFCLVDIYIMLGKPFLPYLEGLNSTQLRLVSIYANRISQARTGTPIDGTQ